MYSSKNAKTSVWTSSYPNFSFTPVGSGWELMSCNFLRLKYYYINNIIVIYGVLTEHKTLLNDEPKRHNLRKVLK